MGQHTNSYRQLYYPERQYWWSQHYLPGQPAEWRLQVYPRQRRPYFPTVPDILVSDPEHSAIRIHYHNAIIKGCSFHWKQCLLRRFRKLTGYADNELMKSDLHVVYGQAFVPIDDVCLGWNLVKPLLTHWLSVEPQQLSSPTLNRTGSPLNNPLYSISTWNCYDSTLSDDARTNNHSERSNNALNIAAGCSNPL